MRVCCSSSGRAKTRNSQHHSRIFPFRNLYLAVLLAVVAATTANVLFYYLVTRILGEPLLMPEQFPPPEASPMPVTDVIVFSLIFALGASVVFVLVTFLRQHPTRTFLAISFITLLLSFYLPLRIPTPPAAMSAKLSLVTMHVIGAFVVVGMLLILGRRRNS